MHTHPVRKPKCYCVLLKPENLSRLKAIRLNQFNPQRTVLSKRFGVMVSYMKGPTFKVLRGGLIVHRSVPRGRGAPAPSHPDCVSDSNAEEMSDVDCDGPESTVDVDKDVSLHAVKQQARATAWGKIRPLLLRAAVESSAMPAMHVCAETTLYRCIQCGSNAYYCHKCFNQVHCATNIFHNGEVWEVCVYYALFIIVEISVCCV